MQPRRFLLRLVIAVGALLGAAFPLLSSGALVSIDAGSAPALGLRMLGALVYAAFGALSGWALGAVLLQLTGRSGPPRR